MVYRVIHEPKRQVNPGAPGLAPNNDVPYVLVPADSVMHPKSNAVLRRQIQHLLTRPVGRPPKKPVVCYHSFMYQAGSWDHERRVVAKAECHQGELFPRVGFIVTNMGGGATSVVWFDNQRGTAEQWIKEGKNAIKWTKLSCHDFVDNQVRLQLFALAYNFGSFLRRLTHPASAAPTFESRSRVCYATGSGWPRRMEEPGRIWAQAFPFGVRATSISVRASA